MKENTASKTGILIIINSLLILIMTDYFTRLSIRDYACKILSGFITQETLTFQALNVKYDMQFSKQDLL